MAEAPGGSYKMKYYVDRSDVLHLAKEITVPTGVGEYCRFRSIDPQEVMELPAKSCIDMIPEKVTLCGIPYRVVLCDDSFDFDLHMGQIKYGKGEIRISNQVTPELQMQTLFHEMLHGMLFLIGRNEEAADENLVQSLANAMYQNFQIKVEQQLRIPEYHIAEGGNVNAEE